MSGKPKRKRRTSRDCQLCRQHRADVAGVCWQCVDTARAAGRCPDCTSVITVAVLDRDDGRGPLIVCECQHDRSCPTWQAAKRHHAGADVIVRGGPL